MEYRDGGQFRIESYRAARSACTKCYSLDNYRILQRPPCLWTGTSSPQFSRCSFSPSPISCLSHPHFPGILGYLQLLWQGLFPSSSPFGPPATQLLCPDSKSEGICFSLSPSCCPAVWLLPCRLLRQLIWLQLCSYTILILHSILF